MALIHPGMLDVFPFLHAEFPHQGGDALGTKKAHQLVFQRQVKAGAAGVSLAAGATPELVVDAAGFMALGPESPWPPLGA